MEQGIPVRTTKGRDALKNNPADLPLLCRNILIQIDGKNSLDDIKATFRGLKGLDEAIEKLFAGRYIHAGTDCHELVKALARKLLGTNSPTLIKKIDELHAKYGEQCWSHLDEIDKHARLFYGQVIADQLKAEISKILEKTRK